MFNANDRARNPQGVRGSGGVARYHKPSSHPKGGLPNPKNKQHSRATPYRPSDPDWQHKRNSATLPNPVQRPPQEGRVRVHAGAGDKCVAPVKSKQKKRVAVPGRPVDTSGLSMDSIIWTDKTYSIEQLIQNYGASKLPLIVRVVEGQHLGSIEDLDVNQVLQVHSFDKQSRVHAIIDQTSGKISLPVDYPMEIYIKDSTQTQARSTLQSILLRQSVPFKALVTSVDEQIDVSTINILGRNLTITDTYEEIFLRTNFINDGWIDQRSIHAVPGYLGVQFVVAIGMRDATPDEWMDYYGMFARSVRHLNFHLLRGYYGIIVEDDGGGKGQGELPKVANTQGPVYENVSNYSDDHHRRSASMTHAQSNRERLERLNRPQNDNYPRPNSNTSQQSAAAVSRSKSEKVRLRPTTMDMDDVMIDNRPSPEHQDKEVKPLPDVVVMYPQAPVHSPVQSPVRSPKRPGTPFSDEEGSDVEEMFRSVLDVAHEQETLRQKRKSEQLEAEKLELENIRAKIIPQNMNNSGNSAAMDYTYAVVNRTKSGESPKANDSSVDVNTAELNKENLSKDREFNSIGQPENALKMKAFDRPSYRSSGSQDSQLDDNDLSKSIEVEVHRNPSPRVSSLADGAKDKDVRSMVSQFEIQKRSSTSLNQSFDAPLKSPTANQSFSGALRSPTVNQSQGFPPESQNHVYQTAIQVQSENNNHRHTPSTAGDVNANDKSPGQQQNHKSSGRFSEMDDVPKNIDNLNTDEICQCLRLLNMDSNIPIFQKHQVDGEHLSRLREYELVDNFKFTPFNASKLMRFARGWRPKVT